MSEALGAINRQVDPAASRIRSPAGRCERCLMPAGTPSTGKTTRAWTLAERYGTVWMPDYGREYWERNRVDRRLTPAQLVKIAEGHIEREELLLAQANRFLFTDTYALTTYMFAQYYPGSAEPRLTTAPWDRLSIAAENGSSPG